MTNCRRGPGSLTGVGRKVVDEDFPGEEGGQLDVGRGVLEALLHHAQEAVDQATPLVQGLEGGGWTQKKAD